jgi:hypothetical protein
MFGWISTHIRNAHCDTAAHTNDAKLGDGVLLEVFGDEFGGVADGEEVAGGSEVFLGHGEGEVKDED